MRGGGSNDHIRGGPGNDWLDGGSGSDFVAHARSATPVVVDLRIGSATGEGDDVLLGFEHAKGSPFDDVVHGDDGDNKLWGFAGDDLLIGHGGTDRADGGDGTDVCDVEEPVNC